MIFNINIKAKFVYNNHVLWYMDDSGMRFSKKQLEEILDSSTTIYKKLPKELIWLDKFIDSDVVVNMKRDKIGRLIADKKGVLQVITLSNLETVCVLCEDSKGGYTFYKYVLSALFPMVNFIFKTTCGNHNITNTLISNLMYDRYVIITDYKQEDTIYMTDINSSEKLLEFYGKSYISFHPISLEEVLLSWRDLVLRVGSNSALHNKLVMQPIGAYYSFNVDKGEYILWNGSTVKNLEKYLFIELNNISKFKYTKDILGCCIVKDCCYCTFEYVRKGNLVKYKDNCDSSSNIDKVKSLATNSLLYILYNVMLHFKVKNSSYSSDYIKYFL